MKARVDLKQLSFRDYEIGNKSSDNMRLLFSKIEFEKEVSIKDAIVSNDIGFTNTKFHSRFKFTMDRESLDNRIIINECLFNGYAQISISKGLIYVTKSEFFAINEKEGKNSNNGNLFFSNDEYSFIQFAQNNFRKSSELDFTQVGGKLYSLRLYENHFETDFKFSEMSIEDLTVRGNDFKAFIDMTNVNFGSFKSELYYNEIANKVGVYSNLDFRGRVWRPKNEESFQDSVASERLFSTYRRITDHFKNRGNLRDYNSMYMEMKDMETLQLQYFYKKDKNLQNWFSWRMNQFLGSFSNYGTSPVKAIIYAINVILFFSLFFFFFHNSWDTFTKEQLMSRILLLTKYFRSEEGIADL